MTFLETVEQQCAKYISVADNINSLYEKDLAQAREVIGNSSLISQYIDGSPSAVYGRQSPQSSVFTMIYYNMVTVKGPAASRAFCRLKAEALVQGTEKRVVEAAHESLVDSSMFDATQKSFQSRAYKEAHEKEYSIFRKLLSAGDKRIPLIEIIDCTNQIVVDNGREIVIKWVEI